MELGLLGIGITEIIAVTKNNAAPIGIILKPDQTPKMILFKGSKTAENILQYGWVTANFVSDSYPYAFYAFNDCAADDLKEIDAGNKIMQVLTDTDAWIAFSAKILHETEQTYFVELTEETSAVIRPSIRPVNRGFNSIIDAAVHATRYIMKPTGELRTLLEYHLAIAKKCGGEREQQAAELIQSVCRL